MALKLMYITNNTAIARAAEENGVDRIWIDLETKGKELRQKNMNTVKSHHTVSDIAAMSKVLTKAELMVRINPWDENTQEEIEAVLAAGADRIMLPMWKTPEEVTAFLRAVNKRAATTLLLETKEAVECLDAVLQNPLPDEIHIGLNDLHLSYGLTFMFELLADKTVETLCRKMQNKGIRYGFGGIARIGEGALPTEKILCEHIRLKSQAVILSRAFLNAETVHSVWEAKQVFAQEIKKLRAKEQECCHYNSAQLARCHQETVSIVSAIAAQMKKERLLCT